MFGVALAEFRVGVEAYWERDTGKVVVLEEGGEEKVEEEMDVDGDDELGNAEEVEL